MSQTIVPRRSEILPEHTWDAASVFPSVVVWETEFQAVVTEISAVERFRGHLGEGPETVAEFFDQAEQLTLRVARVYLIGPMIAKSIPSGTDRLTL